MMHLGLFIAAVFAWGFFYFSSFKINTSITPASIFLLLICTKGVLLSELSHRERMTGQTITLPDTPFISAFTQWHRIILFTWNLKLLRHFVNKNFKRRVYPWNQH